MFIGMIPPRRAGIVPVAPRVAAKGKRFSTDLGVPADAR